MHKERDQGQEKTCQLLNYLHRMGKKELKRDSMIIIGGKYVSDVPFSLTETGKIVLNGLIEGKKQYFYPSFDELKFDITLRENTIEGAKRLDKSKAKFAVFQHSTFNPAFWTKQRNGYLLKSSVSPAKAILDIFENGHLYSFECSTAIVIIFYYAVLKSIRVETFNALYQNLLIWDWSYDEDLPIVTQVGTDFIPGDVLYFYNPDFRNPVWIGENAVYLGDNLYFGHGMGIKTKEGMIEALNSLRKEDATRSAYVLPQHSRLDYRYLFPFAKVRVFA